MATRHPDDSPVDKALDSLGSLRPCRLVLLCLLFLVESLLALVFPALHVVAKHTARVVSSSNHCPVFHFVIKMLGETVVLHWRLFYESEQPQFDTAFFVGASIDDEGVEALVPALLGSRLRNLMLGGNPLMWGQDQSRYSEKLNLRGNNLGDDGARIIATALARNRKLNQLYLCNNAITEGGRDAFCKALCDTSSGEKTYLSNHTTHEITGQYFTNDDYLSYYMRLNRNLDKKMAAAVKILKNHEHIDVCPFFEWGLASIAARHRLA